MHLLIFKPQNPYAHLAKKKKSSRGVHNEWELFDVYFASSAYVFCLVFIYTNKRVYYTYEYIQYCTQVKYIRLCLMHSILHIIKYVC